MKKLICYECGKRLKEIAREDYPEYSNVHYSCDDHGIQLTVSENKEKYSKWGRIIENV